MRLLFICDYFPPFAPGGAEWSIYCLAKALSKKGHKVIILTPDYSKAPLEEKEEGFKIIRYPFLFKLKSDQRLLPYFCLNQPFFYFLYPFL